MFRLLTAALGILWLIVFPTSISAQTAENHLGSLLQAPGLTATAPAADVQIHHFWDRENDLLFAGVATARALDYSSTLNMRRRGRQEILLTDWVVDNHGLFGGIEASGVALSVGLSYAFHRTGHHKIERWVSIVHVGVGTGGAIRNYCLKTAHPSP